MKAISTQKEILIMTGTTFVDREWCIDNIIDKKFYLSKQQMFGEADCWNGILHELLPEIPNDIYKEEKLYLWLVRQGHAFIQLELCPEPLIIEREFSLDPYLFLSAQINN